LDWRAIRPSARIGELVDFILIEMKIKAEDVRAAAMELSTGLFILQLATQEAFLEAREKLRVGVPWPLAGGALMMGWAPDDALVNIRVSNFPINIALEALTTLLGQHGRVVRATRGRLAKLPNAADNTAHVTMQLEKDAKLPAFIRLIDGEGKMCSYIISIQREDEARKCFRCGRGHNPFYCRETGPPASLAHLWADLVLAEENLTPMGKRAWEEERAHLAVRKKQTSEAGQATADPAEVTLTDPLKELRGGAAHQEKWPTLVFSQEPKQGAVKVATITTSSESGNDSEQEAESSEQGEEDLFASPEVDTQEGSTQEGGSSQKKVISPTSREEQKHKAWLLLKAQDREEELLRKAKEEERLQQQILEEEKRQQAALEEAMRISTQEQEFKIQKREARKARKKSQREEKAKLRETELETAQTEEKAKLQETELETTQAEGTEQESEATPTENSEPDQVMEDEATESISLLAEQLGARKTKLKRVGKRNAKPSEEAELLSPLTAAYFLKSETQDTQDFKTPGPVKKRKQGFSGASSPANKFTALEDLVSSQESEDDE
jgi:hypothetical protein